MREERIPAVQTKDELYAIENYPILMQALALGEKIVVNNRIANITIWMDKDYNILGLNHNFKDLPPHNYNEEMTLSNVLLGIIPQLKKQEPEEFESFANRWEEIKTITNDTVGHNKYLDVKDKIIKNGEENEEE